MSKSTRSRDGCGVCRQKRIKCDETRPWCRNCQDRNTPCPGFARQLRWKTIAHAPGAVGKPPRKLPTAQRWSYGLSNSSSQTAVAEQAADLFSSQLVDPCQQPGSIAQDFAWQVHHYQPNSGQTPLHSCPVVEACHQTSPAEQRLVSVQAIEQQDQLSVTSTASSPEIYAWEPCTPKSPTTCETARVQTDTASPAVALVDKVCILPTQPSAHGVSEDVLSHEHASPKEGQNRKLGEDCNLVLNAVNSVHQETTDNAWPSGADLLSAEDVDIATHALLARAGQQHIEYNSLYLESALWQSNIWNNFDDENTLTMHYFSHICAILSCFDSRQNPFRKDIPRMMLSCEYMSDCINSLSAAHLANSICGMDSIAMRHQTRAVRGLMSVIQSIQDQGNHNISDSSMLRLSTTYARHQALVAALLLGISAAWYDGSIADLPHRYGARSLFQGWSVDEGIHGGPQELALLDREQSFIVGAMAYLECLASIIVDQSAESLDYLHRFTTLVPGQRVYPNPWTGISTPLFIYLAEAATIIRRQLRFASQTKQCSVPDPEITSSASKLYRSVLAYHPPLINAVDDTQDANTPLTHLFALDTIYRLVILLELTQVFPEIVARNSPKRGVLQSTLDLAIAILTIVSDLPKTSGANVMLAIPLVSAGSALQTTKSSPRNIDHGYDLDSESFDTLCGQITALRNRPAILQTWRNQVAGWVEQLYSRVGLASVKRLSVILEAVWQRAEEVNNPEKAATGSMIHWMNVMIEDGLETLLG